MTYPGPYCLRHCWALWEAQRFQGRDAAPSVVSVFLNDATKQSLCLLLPSAAVARLLS